MAKTKDLRSGSNCAGGSGDFSVLIDLIKDSSQRKNHLTGNETFIVKKGFQHRVFYSFNLDENTTLDIQEKADLIIKNGYLYNLGTIYNSGTIFNV